MPLICSEALAFTASVKFDGRETEVSAIMSLRSLLLDGDLTAFQGVVCEVHPGVEHCGARETDGEEE